MRKPKCETNELRKSLQKSLERDQCGFHPGIKIDFLILLLISVTLSMFNSRMRFMGYIIPRPWNLDISMNPSAVEPRHFYDSSAMYFLGPLRLRTYFVGL